jgi:hypothetical protein
MIKLTACKPFSELDNGGSVMPKSEDISLLMLILCWLQAEDSLLLGCDAVSLGV